MKKIFAFIMAVLVLSFSTIPCSDEAPFDSEESDHYSSAQSTPQEEPHEDTCSPFCICTCCAGFSINFTSTLLSVSTVPYKKDHSSFNETGTLNIASTIWQPPQLV